MKNSIKLIYLCILVLIAAVSQASAQNVTLAWDQNPESEVVGYNIYYRTDTPDFPFNGTNLLEGASPIFVDGSATTSLTLNLPEDGSIYYFTATAVTNTQIESGFSDPVASEWVPYLLTPTDNLAIDTVATFAWEQPPESYNVSFELFYGTDPNLDDSTLAATAPFTLNSNWPQFKLNIAIPLALLLSLLVLIRSGRAKRVWHPVRVGFCIGIFALQASCGGGGGGGDDTDISPSTSVPSTSVPSTSVPSTSVPSTSVPSTSVPSTSVPSTSVPSTSVPSTSVPSTSTPSTSVPSTSVPSTSVPSTSIPSTSIPSTSIPGVADPDPNAPLFTNVVTDIYATEYQITDLQPNTQYYWKIVAVDNWGNVYESLTQKFTTL